MSQKSDPNRDGKRAILIILAVICGIIFLLMWGLREILVGVFDLIGFDATDMDAQSSLFVGLGLSAGVIVLLAIITGGAELIGDLISSLIGFVILTAFFTLSVAWLF